MNQGTIIRTIARVVASLNTAAYAVSAAVAGLGFNKLTLIWMILTIALDFAVAFFTTYYNNDYTEEACIGTGVTRQLKAEKKPDYIGDKMFPNYDELEDEEEDGEENE